MQPTTVDNTMTGIVLVIIAIVAVLTIVAILAGVRKRRARTQADAAEQARLAQRPAPKRPLRDERARDVAPAPVPSRPEPQADTRTAPPTVAATHLPVAPPPPPLVDMPEVAPEAPLAADPGAGEPAPLADEPIAAAAPQQASLATEAEPTAASASDLPADDTPPAQPVPAAPVAATGSPPGERSVTQIKGLGPKVAAMLAELGITNVGQLAALDQRAAEDLDARLGPFTGRMGRDRWLEQAKLLAAGDIKGFEERFGKL